MLQKVAQNYELIEHVMAENYEKNSVFSVNKFLLYLNFQSLESGKFKKSRKFQACIIKGV